MSFFAAESSDQEDRRCPRAALELGGDVEPGVTGHLDIRDQQVVRRFCRTERVTEPGQRGRSIARLDDLEAASTKMPCVLRVFLAVVLGVLVASSFLASL